MSDGKLNDSGMMWTDIVHTFNDLVDRVAALEKRTPEKRVRYRVMRGSDPGCISLVFDTERDANMVVDILGSLGVCELSVMAEPC